MSTVITAVDPANCCGVKVKLFSVPTEGNMSVPTLENRFVALLRISAQWNHMLASKEPYMIIAMIESVVFFLNGL